MNAEFIVRYIKKRAKTIVVYAVCTVIFLSTFWLYKLPIKAVIYPAILCAVVLIAAAVINIRTEYSRHVKLTELCALKADFMEKALSDKQIAEEEDYVQLINNLRAEVSDLKTEYAVQSNDMNDYYTLWVHQIKTPIASMRLKLTMEDSAFSRKINTDLIRIEQYVEMVLTYLRLSSEQTDYVVKEYELDGIIKASIKKFSGVFIGKKLKLDYSETGLSVITDEKWLTFVIEQILSNAVKYTDKGGVSIYLEDKETLVIEDTGMGIAPEDIPRLFDRGYTGLNGRIDKKASGLGLYLCNRILKKLGHTIRVESEVGVGTKVKIGLLTNM